MVSPQRMGAPFALLPPLTMLADLAPPPLRGVGRGGLSSSDEGLAAAIVLLVATVLYLAYHLLIRREAVRAFFPATTSTPDALQTQTAYFRRGLGAVLFGVVPAIALAVAGADLTRLGLGLREAPLSLALAVGTLALVLPLIALQVRKPAFLAHYPEVRVPWSPRVRALNALSWAVYLLAYELFFRGFLLFALAATIGPLPALAVMVMAYVFVHLDKYPGEAIGTLFTGTGFGVVALMTGSVLMPFLAHLFIALANDELAARRRTRLASQAPEPTR